MKKLLLIAAVATMASAGHAQTKTKATAKTPAKAKATANASGANVSKPVSPVSPASGANTLTTDAKDDAAKAGQKFSASFVTYAEVGASEANYASVKDKSFTTINYVGLGYKADAVNSFGLRQYFSTAHAVKDGKASDTTTVNDPTLTYTRKMGSFLGSEAVSPMFWYYVPVSEASQAINSKGRLRMDAEFNWVITPKWSVSYYLNPRQSFVSDQEIVGADGKTTPAFSRSQLIHYGILYYSFTDTFQAYTYAGMNSSMRTTTATLVDESYVGALGLYATFFKGKFILNPEIGAEKKTVKDTFDVAQNDSLIDEANLNYNVTASITF